MKILWISHFIPYPPIGGHLQRSYNLFKYLGSKHEVYLLALNQRKLLPKDEQVKEAVEALKFYCRQIRTFEIPALRSKWSWYKLLITNFFFSFPYSVFLFHSSEMVQAIKSLICIYPFDLIFLDTIDLCQYLICSDNLPKVLNHHNIESFLLWRRSKMEKLLFKKFYLRLQASKIRKYESQNCKKVQINLLTSFIDWQRLQKIVPQVKSEVIPNGVDTDYFKPLNSDKEENSLIFVGGMNWYPNRDAIHYFLKKIWPLVKNANPSVNLTVIGRDPPKKIKQLSQKDDIRVLGFVEDIRPYVAKASLFIVPIRVGGGTRVKILDAMAMGKAIISTSIGCEGIEVSPGHNIIIADKPEDFAMEILRLLKDQELAAKIGKAARVKAVQKYDWKVIGSKLENILTNLTSSKTSAKDKPLSCLS